MRVEKNIRVINKLGLHTRAAAKLVKLCGGFGSSVSLCNGQRTADAKSIMSVMMLAASQDTDLELVVHGDDAEEAARKIAHLFENCFEEDE